MRAPRHRAFSACTVSLIVLLASGSAAGAMQGATERGEWTLNPSELPDRLQFSLQSSGSDYHHYSSSSDWNIADFQGLDWSTPARHDVHFTIKRDAGVFNAEGFVDHNQGAGLFTFESNPQYPRQMAELGFPGVTEDRQFAFALHDVSIEFARDLKAAGISGLDTDKLIAFRIHGVSPQFIRELRGLGLDVSNADKLIAFRIHGVSPQFIRDLRGSGLDVGNADKLIAFRIHGVSPEFIAALARLGYNHPEPDKLIALRIHGVTPQYIEGLRARGVQNLTLDQLISLRIHGIE